MEQTASAVVVIDKFIAIIKPYSESYPEVNEALQHCDNAVKVFEDGYEFVEFYKAMKAFNLNPIAVTKWIN